MAFFWQNPTLVARGPSGRKIKYHVEVRKAGAQWEWSVSRDTGRGTKSALGIRKTREQAIKAAHDMVGKF